jgi:predicted enzyme related to lactoylglutathione lyase
MTGLLVNIDVDDIEYAIEFYRAAFGLKVAGGVGAGAAESIGSTAPS